MATPHVPRNGKKIGSSRLVPHIKGEHPKQRHERRHRCAEKHLYFARRWCKLNNIQLWFVKDNKGNNSGWRFAIGEKENKRTIKWCPSTAKLIVDKLKGEVYHAHDWLQVQTIVHKEFVMNKQYQEQPEKPSPPQVQYLREDQMPPKPPKRVVINDRLRPPEDDDEYSRILDNYAIFFTKLVFFCALVGGFIYVTIKVFQ